MKFCGDIPFKGALIRVITLEAQWSPLEDGNFKFIFLNTKICSDMKPLSQGHDHLIAVTEYHSTNLQ